MAKIFLGKAFGDSNRKTSKRTLQKYGADSAIPTNDIIAPDIKVSAPIVDTMQQVEKMNVPSVQLGRFADMSVGFDNSKDLQNLANSLGQFNSQLQTTVGTLAKRQKQVKQERQDFAQRISFDTFGDNNSPAVKLEATRTQLLAVVSDPSTSQSEKEAALKSLDYLDSENETLIPYIESTNRLLNVKTNAATLATRLANVTVDVDGESIPLSNFGPSAQEYRRAVRDSIYKDANGDLIQLTPKESKEVAATVIAAMSGDINRQQKAHIQVKKDTLKLSSLSQVNAIASSYGSGEHLATTTENLQNILDTSKYVSLFRTTKERKDFIESLFEQYTASLLNNSLKTNVFLEADIAIEPFAKLMTGPIANRILEDGSINEKLRWHTTQEKDWLTNAQTKYNQKLIDFKKLNSTVAISKSTNQLEEFYKENVQPIDKEINMLADFLEEGIASPKLQSVLRKRNEMYNGELEKVLQKASPINREKILEFSKDFIKSNDETFYLSDTKLIKSQLRKEYLNAFRNKSTVFSFREKVNRLADAGVISSDQAVNYLRQTDGLVNKQFEAYEIQIDKQVKDKIDAYIGKGGKYKTSASYDGDDITLGEREKTTTAETLAKEGAMEIVREGIEQKKGREIIFQEVTDYMKKNNFGMDEYFPGMETYESVDDFKSQITEKINPTQTSQLNNLYKSNKPMFGRNIMKEKLDKYISTGEVDPTLQMLFRNLGTVNNEFDPKKFFLEEFRKHKVIIDPQSIPDSINQDYAYLDKTPPTLPFLQRFAQSFAFIPTSFSSINAANAGEVRSSDPYNYHPTEGSQTVGDMLKISLTSDFTPDEAVIMAAIGMAESSGRPHAHNTVGDDNSYGLWQINMLDRPGFMMGEERRGQFKLDTNEQLFDPLVNGKAAKYIYDMQGFKAWTVYRTGAYLDYLPAAQEALKLLSN